ncbi:4'-phosphopantetheinyl transferase superfamily protein [Sarocladium implicatum]|nr:4'-phosphopantetheinyl transferase superfamily protein [Sarocladium implicatum]
MSQDSAASPEVVQWVIDTRKLWLSANKTAELKQVAAAALQLLSTKERDDVLRFVRVRDAKMALASRLIKRYAIARFCNVPWNEAVSTRDANTKPIFRKPDGSEPLFFNVTHQDGLVILFGVYQPPQGVAIGVDIVSPSERRDRDHEVLAKDGWLSFVDMHAEVFSPHEVKALKALTFDRNTAAGKDKLLRWFYAIWCLREAYVKMTGEALLAKWLRDLEIRNFSPPGDDGSGNEEALMYGKQVEGVDIRLEDLWDGFMVGSVVRRGERGETLEVGEWTNLDVEEILAFGRGN